MNSWPLIMCKYDVIHKPEVHNISQSRATATGNTHRIHANSFGESSLVLLDRLYATAYHSPRCEQLSGYRKHAFFGT